ncbi:MAG: DUF502 domain-containing protein [Planctomycetes bacterium]|nr:DUF502 domain-containing protein [Planctomycetota bacterium]
MLSQAIKAGFKRSFTTGLAALLPTTLTVLILIAGFGLANDYIGRPVGGFVLWAFETYGGPSVDAWFIQKTGHSLLEMRSTDHWLKSAIGFPVAITMIFFAGFLLASFLGKRLMETFDHLVARFPIIGSIYGYGKKVSDFLLKGNRQVEFKSVVLVKYPYEGIWSIGFVTGDGINVLTEREGKDMVTVYIPNAPSLITGWVLILPRTDVIPLPMSVDEAIPFAVSAGVLLPERLKPGQPVPAEETA